MINKDWTNEEFREELKFCLEKLAIRKGKEIPKDSVLKVSLALDSSNRPPLKLKFFNTGDTFNIACRDSDFGDWNAIGDLSTGTVTQLIFEGAKGSSNYDYNADLFGLENDRGFIELAMKDFL